MKRRDFHFTMMGQFKISVNDSEFFCSNIIHRCKDTHTDYYEFHHIGEDANVYLIRYVQIIEEFEELFLMFNDEKLRVVSYNQNKVQLSDESSSIHYIERSENSGNAKPSLKQESIVL